MSTVYVGRVLFAPTDLLQGLNAMLFFFLGHVSGSVRLADRPFAWPVGVLAVAAVAASMYLNPADDYPISMVRCFYCCWPLNVVAAALCTYCLYHIAKRVSLLPRFAEFLAYFGRCSLLVLCVHIVGINYVGKVLGFVINHYLTLQHWQESAAFVCFDLAFALVGAYVLAQSRFLRQHFKL